MVYAVLIAKEETGMMSISEVSKLAGVSIRTLQYYDKIGLLKATAYTESGYRQYDDAALTLLQQILLFRELEFPLKEIRRILCSPGYDKNLALAQQIELLDMKRQHICSLIDFARRLQHEGGKNMEFSAFDKKKMDQYAAQARASWGQTAAYQEYERKNRSRTAEENKAFGRQLLEIIGEFGRLKDKPVDDPAVAALVRKIQDFITAHYYTCTTPILAGLGQMYAAGGDFTANINAVGGPGAAEFAAKAIDAYCTGCE